MIAHEFKIFDAHLHSYGLFLDSNKSIIEYLDAHNVEKAIITTINRAAKISPQMDDIDTNQLKTYKMIPKGQLNHDDVIEICNQAPKRFYPFFWFNPNMDSQNEEESYKILEEHFKKGFCGIKLQPSINLIKIPRDVLKLIDFMQEYNKEYPIFIHLSPKFSFFSGTSIKDFSILATKYPDLTIILGHAALSMELAIDIGLNLKKYKNIIFETSCSIPLGILSLIRNVGHKRLIFGSDAPTTNPLQLEIDKILCLPISKTQKEDIFYNNVYEFMNKF